MDRSPSERETLLVFPSSGSGGGCADSGAEAYDLQISHLLRGLVQMHRCNSADQVANSAWDTVWHCGEVITTSLWRRDTDSRMYPVAHKGLGPRLARARLCKMDVAIGQVLMDTGQPLYVWDICQVQPPELQYPLLTAFERRSLKEIGVRSLVLLPAAQDHVLMIGFRIGPHYLSTQVLKALQDFADHFVQALQSAHERSVDETMAKLGELLSASAEISSKNMDEVCTLVAQMLSAVGVSILLKSPSRTRLELVGSTGLQGIGGSAECNHITYKLDPGFSLTSDVLRSEQALRWPDLRSPTTADRLRARNLVWRQRTKEEGIDDPEITLTTIMVPLVHRYQNHHADKEQTDHVGIIRAIGRKPPSTYFSIDDEIALRRVAALLGQHVGALRRAAAASLDTMQRIAHQFVTPLNCLLWHVEDLRGLTGTLSDEICGSVNSIHHLSLHAANYGQNFELIARLFNGSHEGLQLKTCNLAATVLPTVINFQAIAGSRDIHIHAAAGDEEGSLDRIGLVLLDVEAFRQALVNLLDNAVKYGVEKSRILVRAFLAADGRVSLEVNSLSQIALNAKDVERVFQKDRRTDEARALDVSGTGTGLWLVKEIAQRHGGNATAEPSIPDRRGQRVRFSITFDLAASSTPSVAAAAREGRV